MKNMLIQIKNPKGWIQQQNFIFEEKNSKLEERTEKVRIKIKSCQV